MRELVKCPKCGESYFSEGVSITTCLGWIPVYKDGKLISENPNITSTECTCINCGEKFSYQIKGGKLI